MSGQHVSPLGKLGTTVWAVVRGLSIRLLMAEHYNVMLRYERAAAISCTLAQEF